MKKTLVFFILVIISNNIFAQTFDNANYVIFNFVHRHHGSIPSHLGNFVDDYYWLVPIDSINNKSVFTISPFYVDTLSQRQVDWCANGHSADFFGYGEGASEEYINQIDTFLSIIKQHRQKIQTITLKWYKDNIRKKERIDVYAIPISGIFCNCYQEHYFGGSKELLLGGQVYIPLSNFKYNESFWSSKEWNIVKYVDYSIVNFASFTPWGYQYKTGSLVNTVPSSLSSP
ncbi:hypothetical protein FACS189437_01530 [Bacteroidia bacterium]|nr:hypothetical protein FACS189437_01530 [Bacteroidia bacterium]